MNRTVGYIQFIYRNSLVNIDLGYGWLNRSCLGSACARIQWRSVKHLGNVWRGGLLIQRLCFNWVSPPSPNEITKKIWVFWISFATINVNHAFWLYLSTIIDCQQFSRILGMLKLKFLSSPFIVCFHLRNEYIMD